ncbi:MAG: hypothetical protein MI861_19885 [Pirellulales bacterium]|nr:hypothetical protein [Pirellulales bacterium]
MSQYKIFIPVLIVAVCLSTGCTHTQLRYSHVNQAKTLSGIYEKQVLDNLAMFAGNKNALPFFAVPSSGSATVADSGALSVAPLNGPGHTTLSLSNLSRNTLGSWTMEPVSDPKKLELMRCAYRRAVGLSNPNDVCTNCCTIEHAFSGKDPCCNCCTVRKLKFETCSKRLAHNPCEKVGSYCGTHVRVCPESYDDFTRLVLTILDYAINDPPAPKPIAQAEVAHYHYKKDGDDNYLVDNEGRFIIDYIDTFTIDAHPFTFTEDDGTKATVNPVAPNTPSVRRSPMNQLLQEAIRQQRRDALYPAAPF